MTDRLTPDRYGQPAPAGGHHTPHQETPAMPETPNPAQRLANGYAAGQATTTGDRIRASRASTYRPGQAAELKAAAEATAKPSLRIQAAYAQAAEDAAHDLGQQ